MNINRILRVPGYIQFEAAGKSTGGDSRHLDDGPLYDYDDFQTVLNYMEESKGQIAAKPSENPGAAYPINRLGPQNIIPCRFPIG